MIAKNPHVVIETIGITGHRALPNPSGVTNAIRSILAGLPLTAPILLSALAEGADRLAAHEIFNIPNATLQALLPLAANDYQSDFPTPESRAEFQNLLEKATDIQILSPQPTRSDAYRAVGCLIVDSCDILFAVWDGLPARGRGGTADVVAYARKCGKPIVIINSEDPEQFTCERFPNIGGDQKLLP